MQGFYSRTRIVTLANGLEMVVQFRVVQLDIKYVEKARQILGEVVPQVEHIPDPELEGNGVWIHLMSLVPGKLWTDGDDEGPGNVGTTMSVARIFARGLSQSWITNSGPSSSCSKGPSRWRWSRSESTLKF